jgi:hypothetical protein
MALAPEMEKQRKVFIRSFSMAMYFGGEQKPATEAEPWHPDAGSEFLHMLAAVLSSQVGGHLIDDVAAGRVAGAGRSHHRAVGGGGGAVCGGLGGAGTGDREPGKAGCRCVEFCALFRRKSMRMN